MRVGTLSLLLLCLVISAFSQDVVRAQAASSAPIKIAIANPSRIFNEMQETKALRDKLEARRKELLAKEMDQRNQIEALMKQKAETNPNHPKYREIVEAIDNAKAGLQAWGVATKASVDRDQKAMVKTLYDKIESAIGEVAQQSNIDLVIADGRQDITNLEDLPPEELRRILNSRNILFSTKNIDISETVITVLDKKFVQAGGLAAQPK